MTPIKVFLSHQQADTSIAAMIAQRLRSYHQIDVYLDVIDSNMWRGGLDLADYIREQLEQCTQLLAVISERTKASQWVPWEIGVATEKERPLASFVERPAIVPEFLAKWPYLQTVDDIDKYAQTSKRARATFDSLSRTITASTARRTAFREFHTGLKSALGQR